MESSDCFKPYFRLARNEVGDSFYEKERKGVHRKLRVFGSFSGGALTMAPLRMPLLREAFALYPNMPLYNSQRTVYG